MGGEQGRGIAHEVVDQLLAGRDLQAFSRAAV
jgi:hypothetical protein